VILVDPLNGNGPVYLGDSLLDPRDVVGEQTADLCPGWKNTALLNRPADRRTDQFTPGTSSRGSSWASFDGQGTNGNLLVADGTAWDQA